MHHQVPYGILGIVLLCAVAWLAVSATEPAIPTAAPEAVVELGKSVYRQQRCQTCHSIGGVGNRRYPLDGVGTRLTEEQVRKWIVAPKEMDPKVRKRAYDKLPADELEALVTYLLGLP